MKRWIDRLLVPLTCVVALTAVLAVTVSWIEHPPAPTSMYVELTPWTMTQPHRRYVLHFTPRDPVTHRVLALIPAQRRCVNVYITNSRLTYLDQLNACRQKNGSYAVAYRFPAYDDYVLFAEMHPVGGLAEEYRLTWSLTPCSLRTHRSCAPRQAQLRGLEGIHTQTFGGLTVVLGAPIGAALTGQPVQVSFLFLHGGHPVTAVAPAAPNVVAVSMDTVNIVPFTPDSGHIVRGRIAGGAITYTGQFGRHSIYRLFGTFRYRGRIVRSSFVVDVNPAPTPTPDTG